MEKKEQKEEAENWRTKGEDQETGKWKLESRPSGALPGRELPPAARGQPGTEKAFVRIIGTEVNENSAVPLVSTGLVK